jgi:hypothetical protein
MRKDNQMFFKGRIIKGILVVVITFWVVSVWSPTASVFANNGIYIDSGQRLGNSDSRDVALGDLDNDGDLDAFIVNAGSGSSTEQPNKVWLNDGNGTFTDSGQSLGGANSWGVALGDLDGDGDLDAFVANGYSTISLANKVWVNNGSGVFSDSGQSLGGGRSLDVALGDLDGDDDLDALIGNGGGPGFAWLNNGSGTFSVHCQSIFSGSGSGGVALGDLNAAGGLDIFVTNASNRPNWVWFHSRISPSIDQPCIDMFTDSGQRLGGSDSRSVALGDIDLDEDLDAVVANDGNQPNIVWLNDGNGTFSDSNQRLGSFTTKDIALGDIDGDGDLDAFAANTTYNQVWLNDGAGNFADSGQALGNSGSHSVALGDLDGDGDMDVFVANYNNSANTVWLNNDGFLEGIVDLQGRSDESGAEVCAWQEDMEVDCTITDAAGNYSLSPPAGTYEVRIEMARYLDAEKANVEVSTGNTTILTLVTLLGGDCNDECIVNILDLSFMGFRFGSNDGDPIWDERADINNDGTINILDLTAAGVNYNKTCPVPWP